MHFQNYREFYQSCLIPIGPKDISYLGTPVCEKTAYWLIALEGQDIGKDREYFIWNIVIYQADENGYFRVKQPHFSSSSFQNFDQACSAIKEFKKICMDDLLLTPKEQIS